jgi:hypothetical protein
MSPSRELRRSQRAQLEEERHDRELRRDREARDQTARTPGVPPDGGTGPAHRPPSSPGDDERDGHRRHEHRVQEILPEMRLRPGARVVVGPEDPREGKANVWLKMASSPLSDEYATQSHREDDPGRVAGKAAAATDLEKLALVLAAFIRTRRVLPLERPQDAGAPGKDQAKRMTASAAARPMSRSLNMVVTSSVPSVLTEAEGSCEVRSQIISKAFRPPMTRKTRRSRRPRG